MSKYDDDNYFITFGERRQSREEWIAFGDETDGQYDPSYDAASGSDCMTGYTRFPLGHKDDSSTSANDSNCKETYGSNNVTSEGNGTGCMAVLFFVAIVLFGVVMILI